MKRLSLRTLLTATVVIVVFMALPIRRAIEQKRGRDWIASQNGHVTLSVSSYYNDVNDQWADSDSLRAPQWLVDTLGIDFFDTVDTVILDNKFVNDLSPLTKFRELKVLAIHIDILPEADLSVIAELDQLDELYINYTSLTSRQSAEVDSLQHAMPNCKIEVGSDVIIYPRATRRGDRS